ncbi:tRNA-dihydrouridine synthase C [Cordyceps fumosorosea ARSEF 2679]|uniref:tRNA-dihydrouridine(16/17) synthase [NAD(P)(+)] n=1 Tax=Cordyceps fumosorosea (strain ARSEF 2679) TaxID=1081104 RepID=A0A162N1C9_CORFA|nr:tRNA-dihydrouridine synthase C [Cordyceps fumosorosea ARSEF 2679]OAA73919.1 tRNA-dihydrouridine synthase C [Cordyceps fumosorosea ARSEF 2679]
MAAAPETPQPVAAPAGDATAAATTTTKTTKLHGRAFYESIGSPKFIVAPMVNQSEFAWRMLSRSFLSAEEKSKMLAYTPMFHARLFSQDPKYLKAHFQATRGSGSDSGPWLDGNPTHDRPLFVQFCANDPAHLLAAAQQVAPYCDAVDLNLGCPQGIARKGHYGAFLQEDQDLIFRLVHRLHTELSIPVTAKIRILDTRERTLAYARNVLAAGASILTVHGRRREQKGHLTGVADWATLRFLRDSLPPETVLFANGNVLQHGDVEACLAATGFDGVMSAEGNLSDPGVFARPPPAGEEGREYWRGKGGEGGWRVDAVMRRYLDIIHRYALDAEPPARRPLFVPGDDTAWLAADDDAEAGEREAKRRKTEGNGNGNGASPQAKKSEASSPNVAAMQPHLFHLLRHLVSRHTDVRDMLAGARRAGAAGFERVLDAVERRVAEGLLEYERTAGRSFEEELAELAARPRATTTTTTTTEETGDGGGGGGGESSMEALLRCRRPWWVAQPIVRPLPSEALAKGSIQLSKKERKEQEKKKKKKTGEGEEVKETAKEAAKVEAKELKEAKEEVKEAVAT